MGGRDVISSVVSSQVDLHAAYGGVVPEIASRAHLELLNPVVAAAVVEAGVAESRIDAVACTVGPGLIGALLVGVAGAKALALTWGVPFVAVNHLEAHLYAAFLEEPDLELPVRRAAGVGRSHDARRDGRPRRATACSVRPSTTPPARPSTRWPASWASATRAVRPSTAWRSTATPTPSPFPRAMLHDGLDFSFSGLKTAVVNHVRAHPESLDRARGRQLPAGRGRRPGPQGVEGGASGGCEGPGARRWAWPPTRCCGRRLLDACERDGLRCLLPSPAMCTDNAAMIAASRVVPAAVGRSEPAGDRRGAQPPPPARAVTAAPAAAADRAASRSTRPSCWRRWPA